MSSCSFEYKFDIIRSPEDQENKENNGNDIGQNQKGMEKPNVSLENIQKLNKFNSLIKDKFVKKDDIMVVSQNDKQKKEDSKTQKAVKKEISKDFDKIKKDFKKTIFKNFIDKVKKNNFIFGFQLDSKTRLDYGKKN